MNAVIYARYSCDNQREESIDGQLRECKAFLERQGMTFVRSYIDRAMSAKTDNRPEFQQMIKDSSKGSFDVVVVWKLDRFARNRYDSAHYKGMLRKNGVKVVSATEQISEGAEGIILESVLEGFAEYYSAELSEKVIRGMTENALKCQYNGGCVAVGYYIDENKHYQIDEQTAPFIRNAFEMYASGSMVKEIADYLNDNGVRSSANKPFTKTTVAAIFQNRKYIGEYKYRDVLIPDGVPRIISDDTFLRVQERVAKNRYAPGRLSAKEEYLLTTKLCCGECGAYMVGESGTSNNGMVYHYYKCATAKKKKGCNKKSPRKEKIEGFILKQLSDILKDKEIIRKIAKTVIEFQNGENKAIPLLEKQLDEVNKSITNILNAIQSGIYTATVRDRLEALEEERTELEVKIANEKIAKPVLTEKQVEFWLTQLAKNETDSLEQKRRLIDAFLNSVFLYEDSAVITFNYKFGSKTVSLADIHNYSDLTGLGEPLKQTPVRIHGSFCLYQYIVIGLDFFKK